MTDARWRLYHAGMDLSGRVAVVTGASSGIGLAIAQHLSREGVGVVLGARRADRLDDAVRGIRAAGGRADYLVMDVTSETSVQHLVQHARITVIEMKALCGLPRRQAILLLEHLDALGTTRREGDARVAAGARP